MADKKFTMKNSDVRNLATLDAAVSLALESPDDGKGTARDTHNASWAGSASLDAAASLAREGWAEVRPDIDAALSGILPRLEEVTRRRITRLRSVAGGSVNVARMMSGDPRCMVRSRIVAQPTTGPLVRILVNGSASSGVSTDRIMKRGAAVVALVEAISLCGANSTVTVAFPGSGSGGKRMFVSFVQIKGEAGALDINALMFALAHPSMLRRIMFACWETEPIEVRRVQGFGNGKDGFMGYGRVVRFDEMPDELLSNYVVKVDAPSGYETIRPETDPIKWIDQTLTGIGLITKEGN